MDILIRAACCGVMFDIHDLAHTQQCSHKQILEILEPAFDLHLIVLHSGKDKDTDISFSSAFGMKS